MDIFKIFRPKRKVDKDPAEMMRTLEETMKKRDKRSSYRWKSDKKK
ncbi:MAG: hypothetical protein HFG67_01035 [Firmicutes bacterium]|nr:hypothetical protein [Bacillota bacterium]